MCTKGAKINKYINTYSNTETTKLLANLSFRSFTAVGEEEIFLFILLEPSHKLLGATEKGLTVVDDSIH